MNKYQKQAALDIIKAITVGVIVGVVLITLGHYFTFGQIGIGVTFALLVWCGYNLFQLRVDQYRTLDEIKQRNSK